jgi:hypothetical protein
LLLAGFFSEYYRPIDGLSSARQRECAPVANRPGLMNDQASRR